MRPETFMAHKSLRKHRTWKYTAVILNKQRGVFCTLPCRSLCNKNVTLMIGNVKVYRYRLSMTVFTVTVVTVFSDKLATASLHRAAFTWLSNYTWGVTCSIVWCDTARSLDQHSILAGIKPPWKHCMMNYGQTENIEALSAVLYSSELA